VLLLSDRFWRREFDARRDVLGGTIRIAGSAFTIIGVTPPEFFGLVLGRSPDVYLPLGTYAVVQPGIVSAENHQFWMVRTVGRLARTVSDQTAAARLTTVLQASFAADPKPVIELLPIDIDAFEDGGECESGGTQQTCEGRQRRIRLAQLNPGHDRLRRARLFRQLTLGEARLLSGALQDRGGIGRFGHAI
jgi:hypothetical protein